MRRFIDTNILVYALDRDEPAKRDIARAAIDEAIAQRGFVVSTQVLAEFYATAVRQKLVTPAEALELVRLWSVHDTVVQSADLVLRSIALHQEHSLAFWDAQIVQAALDAGCDILLSEDMQHGRRFGALEIVNPFAGSTVHERRAVKYAVAAPPERPRARQSSRS